MRKRILLWKKTTLICNRTTGFPLPKTDSEPDYRTRARKSSALPAPASPERAAPFPPSPLRLDVGAARPQRPQCGPTEGTAPRGTASIRGSGLERKQHRTTL